MVIRKATTTHTHTQATSKAAPTLKAAQWVTLQTSSAQVWFGSRVVVLVTDPDLGRLVNRNPNRHAYPHLGDLKSKADNASFFSSITTARECANFAWV